VFEPGDFLAGQFPMRADRQARVADRPKPHPAQAHHRVSNRFAHVAHLARAPFADHDGNHRLIFARPQLGFDEPHGGGRRAAAVDVDATAQAVERRVVGHPAQPRVIFAFDLVTRVQQPFGQGPVVGEQNQPFGVVVEPPDRVDVLPHVGQQVEHR